MRTLETSIPGVLIFEPDVFRDDRGFFFEAFNLKEFCTSSHSRREFVQDNHSGSVRNVVRGLHYQIKQAQGKLVRVIAGRILDIAVDLRKDSVTYGAHVAVELSSVNRSMLWIPEGFAHGFAALDDWNEVLYKATDYYAPQHERSLLWNDPQLSIDWRIPHAAAIVTDKDRAGSPLSEAETYP
jgi:dTDP-4-dehydrorhamnose 3,5-epimerase